MNKTKATNMKNNIFNRYGAFACLAFMLASCSPEDYTGVDEAGLPLAENAQVKATVDDETNTVTFTMEGTQIFPVWYLPVDGKEITKNPVYSTVNPMQKIWAHSGDYELYYRVGNHNGMSQGMGKTTFHVANSLTNYDELIAKLSAKPWRIASTEAAHMACGQSGTDGTGWWSAGAGEKAEKGVYDDRISFGTDGTFTYDPGVGGTVYVNTSCSLWPDYHQTEDYMVPVEKQTSSYELSTEGDNIYMTMPAKTLFPYIPTDAAYNGELKLRIESFVGSKLVLVWDDGNIAWHYIFTNADEGFLGFEAKSDCNLFKNCKFTHTYYYAPGWSQIADPQVEDGDNNYVISLPTATSDTWQAQVFWHTDITTNSANKYDFSCKVTSTTDHNNVTVKLADEGDDGKFYFAETIKLKANQEYIFYKSAMPGIDMDKVKLVMDFGGNAADTKVTVSDIDLQESGCDGVVPPAEDNDKTVYTYDNEANLWKTNVDSKGTNGFTPFFYYAPGWSEIAAPELTVANGHYTIDLPTACAGQWQAQFHLTPTNAIAGQADTPYDFSCKFMASKDIKGVTVKITDTASDDNFFFANQYDLTAGEEFQVKVPASVLPKGEAKNLKLVFDFGNTPEGEKIEIYDIILQLTAK